MFKLFYIFVEGSDDKRFFENLIVPKLYEKYGNKCKILVIPYQQRKNADIKNNIVRYAKSNNMNYVFLADLDSVNYSSFKEKIKHCQDIYPDLDYEKIFIVVEEIESWYLSGIDDAKDIYSEFEIPDCTDDISKEDFEEMIRKSTKFNSKLEFMEQICRDFDFDKAVERNTSLKYFLKELKLL